MAQELPFTLTNAFLTRMVVFFIDTSQSLIENEPQIL